MKIISILGCGWVGRALADALEPTCHVHVAVRSKASFERLQFKHKFQLSPHNNHYDQTFYTCDTLVIAIPPRGHYLELLQKIPDYLEDKATQVILYSSTSVYPHKEGEVIEEDTDTLTNPSIMLQAERILRQGLPDCTILRLGGLMGYDRIAGKYTAGKTVSHDAPVNYIHRDDVVEITKRCIQQEISHETYNLVAPKHPLKSSIYLKNATQFGFEHSDFSSKEVIGKCVSSEKLVTQLPYQFHYPDPLDFWVEIQNHYSN